jgi:phage terminase large subunit-like protein
MQRQLSCADLFRTLPPAEQIKRINALSDDEVQALVFDWSWHGRPDQQIPGGTWITWLILAGRGWGKTRTGVETVRHWVKK